MRGVTVRNVGLGFLSGQGWREEEWNLQDQVGKVGKLGTVTVDSEEQSQMRDVEAGGKHGPWHGGSRLCWSTAVADGQRSHRRCW